MEVVVRAPAFRPLLLLLLLIAPQSTSGESKLWSDSQVNTTADGIPLPPASSAAAGEASPFDMNVYRLPAGGVPGIPKFAGLQPDLTEQIHTIDIGGDWWMAKGFSTNFAVRITGFFEVSTSGVYSFFLKSDDGSRLSIDGMMVINNTGHHRTQLASSMQHLDAGMHMLDLQYFQAGGDAELRLECQRKGDPMGRMLLGNEPSMSRYIGMSEERQRKIIMVSAVFFIFVTAVIFIFRKKACCCACCRGE